MDDSSKEFLNIFDILNNKGINNFEKNLSELSDNLPKNITININSQEKNLSFISDIDSFYENFDDLNLKNQKKDSIYLIKIKDENYLESGMKIENYLNFISNINDENFSKCEKCKIDKNSYYCSICKKNFCVGCRLICKNKMHIIKELNSLKNDVDNYKKYIQLFISKFYIEVSQKQIEGIEKKENNYNIFDSNDIINEIGENINNYTYDIILIKTLIDKDYINYNHYMNIEESYSYLLKKTSKFQKFLYELNMSENKQSQIIEIEIFFKPNIKNIELNGVNEYLGEIYTNLLIEEKNINIKPKIGYIRKKIKKNNNSYIK